MKHATDKALDRLDQVLLAVRTYPELKEKKRGIFYYKSSAFLHFHEDAAGLFADLRIGGRFERFAVNTISERKRFETALRNALQ
jgi:hypothetical protein